MDPSEAAMEDAFQVLGLLKKDYARPANTATLDALGTRQLAYTVAGILDSMSASDVLEIGGDMVPWMSVSRLHVFRMERQHTQLSVWSWAAIVSGRTSTGPAPLCQEEAGQGPGDICQFRGYWSDVVFLLLMILGCSGTCSCSTLASRDCCCRKGQNFCHNMEKENDSTGEHVLLGGMKTTTTAARLAKAFAVGPLLSTFAGPLSNLLT